MAEKRYLSLSELQSAVSQALDAAFPLPVWIVAEIADLRVNAAGHCYLELVEKAAASGGETGSGGGRGGISGAGSPCGGSGVGSGVPKASARAVIWRGNWPAISAHFHGMTGSRLEAGMKVLVKVSVSYHELYGFSLVISDIDPSYTIGDRQRQRLETIARLKAEGVFDMNRELGLPAVVQRVAVISSATAAGFRDFMQELDRYPLRFEVALFEATMQGHATEDSVISALEAIAERFSEFDAVVVIRGGGSQTDLSAFDGYRLCAHVAQFPLPVLTGIGHDKDRSVADMVAFLELKTPTAVAVWLGEGLMEFSGLVDELSKRLDVAVSEIFEREKLRIERAARVVSIGAVEMTRRLEMRLERLGAEMLRRSGEYFLRENHRLENFSATTSERPAAFLTRAAERLTGFENFVALRRPEKILELGFAIVRPKYPDGRIGRALLDPAALPDGKTLEITLAKGKITAKKC